jgi:hypothetical protein
MLRFNYIMLLLCAMLAVTACTGGKGTAAADKKYVPVGVSAAMMRLLNGSWEVVGITMDGKPVTLPAKGNTDIAFAKDKMTLAALGKKESATFTVKDKMIICPDKPAERPLRIASVTRTDLVLNFTASNGKPVEMVFLRK